MVIPISYHLSVVPNTLFLSSWNSVLSAREWLNVSSYGIPCWSMRLDGGQRSGAFLQPCDWFVKISDCVEKFLNCLLTRLQLQGNILPFLFSLIWFVKCYEEIGRLVLIIS